MTQAQLAARLQLDRSAVSRLVDALERRQWVRRVSHAQDRRALHVLLSEQGRAAADRLAGARRARLATLLEAIPAHERQKVLDSLGLLADALDRSSPERHRV